MDLVEKVNKLPFSMETYILLEFFRRAEILLREEDRQFVPVWKETIKGLLDGQVETFNYRGKILSQAEALLDGAAYYLKPIFQLSESQQKSILEEDQDSLSKPLHDLITIILADQKTLQNFPMTHFKIVIGNQTSYLVLGVSAPYYEQVECILDPGKHRLQIYGYIRGDYEDETTFRREREPWLLLHRDSVEVQINNPIPAILLAMRDQQWLYGFKMIEKFTLKRLMAVKKLEVRSCRIPNPI